MNHISQKEKRASKQAVPGKRLASASRPDSGKKPGIVAFMITGTAILVFIAILIWSMFIYDGIYPNIEFAGVDIGGMSREEARTAIESVLATYTDKKIEVAFEETTRSISIIDAGLIISVTDALDAAVAVGRTGHFFQRAGDVISSIFVTREILTNKEIDMTAVYEFLREFEQLIDNRKAEPSYVVHDSRVEIDLGKSGRSLDTEKAAKEMSDKLYGGNLDPISLEDYLIIDKTKEINLLDIYNEICREEADAHLDISGEEPRIVPHVTGISFNLSKAESMLAEVLNNGGDKLVIPLVLTEPEITTEEFEELLFRDVLAEAKTTLNARNTNRTGNVKLSANTINGVILNPGDIFSYNDTVGERTYEKGYKDASAYTSSGIEDQLGGGICQTSSTLYMTVIRAGLEIIERYNHAYTVVYAPLGEDATIYWGSLDFKFANNRKFPIKIEAYQEKDYVVVRLLGTKTDNNRVEISTVVLSHTPYETFTVENPNLDYGVRRQKVEGHSAYHVETYRIVYDENGKEISREKLPNSRYKRLDRVIEVGTKGAPEETVSPIETDGPSAPPSDPPSASPSVPPTTSPTTHPSDQPTVPPTAYPSDPPQDPSPPADTATPSPAVSPSVSPPEPTPASTSEPDSP